MVYGVVIGTLLLIFSKTIINTWGRGRGVGSILVDWRGKSLFHLAVFRGHNHTKHFAVYMSNIELLLCTHYIAIIRGYSLKYGLWIHCGYRICINSCIMELMYSKFGLEAIMLKIMHLLPGKTRISS